MKPPVILGAGMAGLLAGALSRKAFVYEAKESLPNNHSAVLRFREDTIGRALDIPFKEVTVLKGVVGSRGSIQDANAYALKVTGAYSSRSILNLEPAQRYIAPPDFIPQLAELNHGRIVFDSQVDGTMLAHWRQEGRPIISTIPMPAMMLMTGIAQQGEEFAYRSVRVRKLKLIGCDLYQTLYFPYDHSPFYRATITGDELILETTYDTWDAKDEFAALHEFGISVAAVKTGMMPGPAVRQHTLGKINPLPRERRRAIMRELTTQHGVYSLGRYACWRNILLDDVFRDYFAVHALMNLEA